MLKQRHGVRSVVTHTELNVESFPLSLSLYILKMLCLEFLDVFFFQWGTHIHILFVIVCLFFETESHCVDLAGLEFRPLPASACRVLRLKACTTMSGCLSDF